MSANNDTTDDVQLDEQRIREIAREEMGVRGSDGKKWTLADLADIGLSRRQAVYALGMIGTGMASGKAIKQSMGTAQAASSSGQVDANVVSTNSVETGELNKTRYLDPDASDFGAALQSEIDAATAGDVIMVPPVDYDTGTEPVLDKNLSIVGFTVGSRQEGSGPQINKTADVWGIKCAEGVGCRVEGLEFVAPNISDTTGGVKVRGSSTIRDVKGRDLGSHVIDLTQETTNDNMNLTEAWKVTGIDCGGDVVHIENASGGINNINSCSVHVVDHYGNSGWAVNIVSGSNATDVFLNSAQATTSGCIRFGSQKCRGYVLRHESSGPVVQFDNSGNHVEVLYDNSGNAATWNNNNNTYCDLSINERENRFREHRFSGSPLRMVGDQAIQFEDENGDLITLFADAGELKVTDAAGNTTTLS